MDINELLRNTLVKWRETDVAAAVDSLIVGNDSNRLENESILYLGAIRVLVDYIRGYGSIQNEKDLQNYITFFESRTKLKLG